MGGEFNHNLYDGMLYELIYTFNSIPYCPFEEKIPLQNSKGLTIQYEDDGQAEGEFWMFWEGASLDERLQFINLLISENIEIQDRMFKYRNFYYYILDIINNEEKLPPDHDDILGALYYGFYIYKDVSLEEKKRYFYEKLNPMLQRYLFSKMQHDGQLDLPPIFPGCHFHTGTYCEGRRWKKRFGINTYMETCWCPLVRDECKEGYIKPKVGQHTGVGLTLFETIQLCNFDFIFHFQESEYKNYLTKIFSWCNRLNKLGDKLRCRTCSTYMVPNLSYSKYSEIYNVTLFSCPTGHYGHDHNIYLNRCWHCYQIIDSREAPFRVDPVTGFVSMESGHFICLHCASAPKKHKVYRQGDCCPKCGDSPMLCLNESEFQCKTCFHKITRPESRKLTGFEKAYVRPYFTHL